MAGELTDRLLARLGVDDAPPEARGAIDDAVTRQLARAAAEWPGIGAPADDVAALWAERVTGTAPAELAAAIDALRGADLYIACACARADPAALRAFERRYLADLDRVLARITTSADEIAEVTQEVRRKLFVADGRDRPRILTMVGHGDLGGLMRVAAIRTALNLRRGERRHASIDDHAELAVLAPDGDPELDAIRSQHRALVKHAIEEAVLELGPRDRSLLRMHLVDRLSIDDIGRAHEVHRATAARWLEHVRATLRTATLRRLRARLGGDSDGLEDLTRIIDSRLHVSFQRLLAAD